VTCLRCAYAIIWEQVLYGVVCSATKQKWEKQLGLVIYHVTEIINKSELQFRREYSRPSLIRILLLRNLANPKSKASWSTIKFGCKGHVGSVWVYNEVLKHWLKAVLYVLWTCMEGRDAKRLKARWRWGAVAITAVDFTDPKISHNWLARVYCIMQDNRDIRGSFLASILTGPGLANPQSLHQLALRCFISLSVSTVACKPSPRQRGYVNCYWMHKPNLS
jgi:hypothetical protein